jgi:hypothetical protein
MSYKKQHEAYHLTRRGWTGLKDYQLRDLAIREELIFVTNNARDFRRLMGAVELHAGLIVIIPNATPIGDVARNLVVSVSTLIAGSQPPLTLSVLYFPFSAAVSGRASRRRWIGWCHW